MTDLFEKGNLEMLSNTVFLSENPIPDYMAAFEHSTLPEFLLPVFLHEATHHWCLTSVVGNALAVNDLKIQRAFLGGGGLLDGESLELWSRTSAIRRLLEPMLEGLAQFAEFDTYPGASPVLSPAEGWAAFLFTRDLKLEIPPTMPIERLRYLLCAYRSSEIAMRRKSDILVRPLTTANGGYLIGYLSVKNIWSNALKRSKRLTDSSLFLSYLRNVVFEDPSIADMILETSGSTVQVFNDLLLRFHQRLKLLGSQDLEDRVKRFERSIAETGTLDGHWDSVYVDENARKRTTERLSECLSTHFQRLLELDQAPAPSLDAFRKRVSKESALPQGTALSKKREQLIHVIHQVGAKLKVPEKLKECAFIDAAPMIHRTLVRIRVDQVYVEIESDLSCTVSLNALPLFNTVARADTPKGSGPGLLALYFLPDYEALALICVKDDRYVFGIFPKAVPEVVRDHVALTLAQVILNEKGRMGIPSVIRLLHEFGAGLSDDSEALESQLEDSLTFLYLNYATCFVSDQNLDSCVKLMRENGFWQLLDESGDRVSGLATLGLMSSFIPAIQQLDGLIRLHGFDLSHIIKEIEAAQDRFGYPILITGKETLRCLV